MLSSPRAALLLLSLSATAAAFLFDAAGHHHRPRAIDASQHHFSLSASIDEQGGELDIRSQINEQLVVKLEELLADTLQLPEQYPKSTVTEDNERRGNLTTEQMVYETLLSSRLPLPFLNRSKVAKSNIDGAGKGLFATESIAKGEVITCYPGDALLYEMPSSDGGNDDADEDEEVCDEEEDYVEEMVLWGNHVPSKDVWDEDTVFDGNESCPPLTSYAVACGDWYSVMGHPALDDDPAYFGHFANDGAGHLASEAANAEMGVEEGIARYVLQSQDAANAMHKPVDESRLHVVTVATRDIKQGEEVLVTYGPDYWMCSS
ncbi:hypothetical protein ACHAXT_009312 [Thalassiosira profunda]